MPTPLQPALEILYLYVSPEHNYFGHHGRPAGTAPILELDHVECVAGRGLVGDRFFDHQEDYKGQITFFDWAVYQDVAQTLNAPEKPPSAFRRNVITRGQDLNALIGVDFELQGVLFRGVAECSPCYWMDAAFAPGAESALKGRGGLRARILSSGTLSTQPRP